ncbi:uncharacterized protein LOC128984277 [Macrosteles quadrilineatus]|uniref:uncharacterized protein LOC128984277 n=1 Tax=Macrosteles quadrilineatus TaxID=74068 RepID=UPI0023E0F88E|nr:uncharacterized protein LOC128984277 [Macrosteles quadrilineatus]
MLGMNDEEIEVIPNNEERYISYTVKRQNMIELRFLDSFKFMSSSLDALTKNLQKDQFTHTAKYFNESELNLVLRKGIYPYDYMDSEDKYELTHLPKQEEFYNILTKTDVDPKDYEHAKRVWDSFKMKDMKEYTLMYNKSDVLLLADVMENFRNVCMSTYKLDPAWFFTTPGLAWSAMLKTTNVELELISDYDMLLMIEKGIRGGVSQSSNRHAKANNPYMNDYDSSKPTEYLVYLDANNLYGWAMVQHMPYGDFKWCDTNIDVTEIPDDADTGYILEVDLEYPKDTHDLHSDLPLAPEQRVPPGGKEVKLLTTLYDKEKYVVHYRNLKLYLKLGLKLKKIHRVISFRQSNWIATYIDLNTKLRTQAKNDFEKEFYKLMNNGVFGKTMENIRNRVDVRLATKEKQIVKWIAQPTFKDRTIFAENLSAVHMKRTKLLFNKPIYVGMSVLDVSKTLIYDFHYNVIKSKYGDKARLQYTDTDSLKYAIATSDFYQDMKTMIDYFDTSDYPENNPYGMPRVNKKVLGKMKDELSGRIMREQIALRSKMYAHEVEDGSVCKKSKGVKKSVTEKEITFDDYKKCLFEGLETTKTINMIRSFSHDLYTIALNKVVLSNQDDKRYILDDGIHSLPWGHYSINH